MYASTARPVEKLSCSIQRNKCWQRNWPVKFTEYKMLMEIKQDSKKFFKHILSLEVIAMKVYSAVIS